MIKRLSLLLSPAALRRRRKWNIAKRQVALARSSRRELLVGSEDLVRDVSSLLFDDDPMGINFEENSDEYDPEAETIVIRLQQLDRDWLTDQAVTRIVHEEFRRWFGEAGPESRYAKVASEIRKLILH
jgi:hypothetical protein